MNLSDSSRQFSASSAPEEADTVMQHEITVRYLLRDLSEQESTWFEKKYFASDEFFASVLATESRLIEAGTRKELPPRQQVLFDHYYPNPPAPEKPGRLAYGSGTKKETGERIRSRLRLPHSERKGSVSHRSARPHSRGTAVTQLFVMLVLLLTLTGTLLTFARLRQVQNQLAEISQSQMVASSPLLNTNLRPQPQGESGLSAQLNSNQSASEVSRPAIRNRKLIPPVISRSLKTKVPSLTLLPGQTRGQAEERVLRLNPLIPLANLNMEIPPHKSHIWRAVLRTVDGNVARTQNDLKASITPEGNVVVWNIATSDLKTGDYIVELADLTEDGQSGKAKIYFLKVRN